MSKLKAIAKAHNYKLEVEENPYEAYVNGFTEGFKYAVKHINELIDAEKETLKTHSYMGERLFALQTYQNRINKALKELEEESF